MLAKLNKLNSNLNGHQAKKGQLKVPYTTFYIPQLADKIDIQTDYMRWVHADLNGPGVSFLMISIKLINCTDLNSYIIIFVGPGFLFL